MQKNLLEKTKRIRLNNGKTVYEEIIAQNTRKPEERPKQKERSDRNVRQNNQPVWDDDER
ncbi:MAG: hypothetical protein E7654_08950 [Ruminococcaceae bacterium]|nr:hypothetical protein [Oscillospiraceae bacterium]